MEQKDQQDLATIKELLRHSSEFIAYFEIAESKMLEWKQDLEEQSTHITQQQEQLHKELNTINNSLSEAGITRFRISAEHSLAQGEAHLKSLEKNTDLFMEQLNQKHEELSYFTQQCIEKIEQQSRKAVEHITNELKHYDVSQFHRIANESCVHVERIAQATVSKSKKLLGLFQLRYGLFAVFTTVLTAFIVALYLNDELPWEMHHKAVNERQAGKVLLDAWPSLSKEVKAKILRDDRYNEG